MDKQQEIDDNLKRIEDKMQAIKIQKRDWLKRKKALAKEKAIEQAFEVADTLKKYTGFSSKEEVQAFCEIILNSTSDFEKVKQFIKKRALEIVEEEKSKLKDEEQ